MKTARSLRGAFLIVAALAALSGSPSSGEAAERLSPSTKKLFDAVWSDNLASVKASIARGADVNAINEFGVRAVDLAVDKGHFDIAHYLLSVERLNRVYGAKAQPAQPTAAVAATAETAPSPVSPVIAAPLPPEPAPTAVAAVQPASQAPPAEVPPAAAPSTVNYWTPGAGGAGLSEPGLRVVSVAEPVEIPPASPTAPEKTIEAPAQSAAVDAPRGVMSRIGDWFTSDSDDPAAVRDAGDRIAEKPVPVVNPEPPAAPPVAEAEIAKSAEIAATPVEHVDPPEGASEETEKTPSVFDRLAQVFERAPAEEQPEPTPTAAPEPAVEPSPVVPIEPEPIVADAPPAMTSEETENEPGVFDRLAQVFERTPVEAQPSQTLAEELETTVLEPAIGPSPVVQSDPEQAFSPPKENFADELPALRVLSVAEPIETPAPEASSVVKEAVATDVVDQAPESAPEAIVAPSPVVPIEPEPTVAEALPVEHTDPSAITSEIAENEPGVFDRLAQVFERASVEEQPEPTPVAAPEPVIEPNQVVPIEPVPAVAEASPVDRIDPPTNASEESEAGPSVFDRLARVFERDPAEEQPEPIVAEAPRVDRIDPPAVAFEETEPAEAPEVIAREPAVEPSPIVLSDPEQAIAEAPPVERVDPPAIASEETETVPSVFGRLAEMFERASAEEQPKPTIAEALEVITPEPVAEPSPIVSSEPEPAVVSEQAAPTPGIFEKLVRVFESPADGEQQPDQTSAEELEATVLESTVEPNPVVPNDLEQAFLPPKENSAEESPDLRVVSVAEPVETPAVNEAVVADAIESAPKVAEVTEVVDQASESAPEVASGGGVIDRLGTWFSENLKAKSPDNAAGPISEVGSEDDPTTEPAAAPLETKDAAAPSRGEKRLVRPAQPVETASRRTEVPSLLTVTPLDGVIFLFDDTKRLGATLAENDPRRARCVDKRGWDVVFCIEPAFWPKDLASPFDVQSVFYRGAQAIVRYVGGRVDQYHALFASHEYDAVTAYYRKRYGPPTETPEIWTALIGKPKRLNPTQRWISKNPVSGEETVLEIRQTDDLRWSSPPDLEHGMVRLSRRGARSVFELLTSTDLMLANIRGQGR